MILRFGDRDLDSDVDDLGTFTRPIKKVHRHPLYQGRDRTAYYDIAIWEVEPFEYNSYVRPICLPSEPNLFTDRYAGQFVTISGIQC